MDGIGHRKEETGIEMLLVEEMIEITVIKTGNGQTEDTTVTEIEDMTVNGTERVVETRFHLPMVPPTP